MEKFYFEVPSMNRKEDAVAYINEFYEFNSDINGTGGLQRFLDHYEGWLDKLQSDYTRTANEKKVPARTYFLVRSSDNRIVGMINIRLALNDNLRKLGGHIGYSIRPTERGKGYNKINLYLGLKVCQKYGIDKVLMDADKDNPASWKTMEALGGVNVREFYDNENAHCMVKDYEINVNESILKYSSVYEPMLEQKYVKEYRLALSDDILMKIEKPERYIGHEVNSVVKDRQNVSVRFAMCFPDVYEIGMSHLGIQILYDMFNSMEDVWCERVYSPWLDLDAIMREQKIPLFALESQDPVKDFDFLGITIQYELCYTNILQILDLAQIPIDAVERGDYCPIVIGGGPCAYNPEPLADFFDIFYIGEGETQYRNLLNLYKECRDQGLGRVEFLRRAARLPGMYVPRFYRTDYNVDGTIKSFTPTESGIPEKILKEIVSDVTDTYYPMKPIVPFIKITQDRVVLEIQRGCIRGCRFCQAGQLYRPVRERDVDTLKKWAVEMLKNTGHEEISLSSLSSSDYTKLPELVDFLIEECGKNHTNISLPSLRIDAFSLDVMGKVQDVRKSSLTFAPEAGSQRLRNVINKGLTEEVILKGAGLAFEGGWTRVKLYFMLGLPTETEEDIRGIAELANKIAALFYETVPKDRRTNGRVQVVASTSFFVPKPFTPFQWAAQCTKEEFIAKAYLTRAAVSEQLNRKSIKYNWHEADASVLEGVLARGDRRLCRVIRKVYEKGSFYDAWGEYYDNARWLETIEECGLSVDFYAHRERSADEILPWDFIDCGVSKEYLLREWERAKREEISENCRQKCQGCGAAKFGCGICAVPRKD